MNIERKDKKNSAKDYCLSIVFLSLIILFLLVFTLFFKEDASKFQWSEKNLEKMNWEDAVNYCRNLNEGGYSDWKMPSISELRTLIQNCSDTETGGWCGITDECLAKRCRDDSCSGCEAATDGRYSKLGDTGFHWSASSYTYGTHFAWGIDFQYGYIFSFLKRNRGYVRCVRKIEPTSQNID